MCEIIWLTEEKPIVNICNYCIGLKQYLPGGSSCVNLDNAINEENPKIEITTSNTFCFISEGIKEYTLSFYPNISYFNVYINYIRITNINNIPKTFTNLIIDNYGGILVISKL